MTEIMLGSARVPENVQADPATEQLLAGVTARPAPRSQWEYENQALALLAARCYSLRHPCESTPRSPGCSHRDHARDMATLRGDLDKLGLPGTIELIPLADEVRRQELGERYQG